MSRLRPVRVLAAAALLAAGCGDQISSMTQHFFYGYVTSAGQGELCLSDARTEDTQAERCFEAADADLARIADGDLIKVRYERTEDGHGGRAIDVEIVRSGGRPDE